MALPDGRLHEISTELAQWIDRTHATKREILSLVGKLSWASECIPFGRIFVRRLLDLAHKLKFLHHKTPLNHEFRADLD